MSDRVLSDYYAAFNRGDSAAMLALLTDDVVHEPSQGAVRWKTTISPTSSAISGTN